MTPHILMDATIQAILQLDAMMLHSYVLLVFAIHALTATSFCNRNTCLLTATMDATIQALIQLDVIILLTCCTYCSIGTTFVVSVYKQLNAAVHRLDGILQNASDLA